MYYIFKYTYIHSVSDQQVKKNQTITILTYNKTKFRNTVLKSSGSLSFIYQCFCCCLEVFLLEILRL